MNRKDFLQRLGIGAVGLASAQQLLAKTTATVAAPAFVLPKFDANHATEYWERVRAQYPITDERVYFNCGGLGPAPRPVLEAAEATTRLLQKQVETGHDHFEAARITAAEFLGATADEICFVRNATEGNSIVAVGLPLQAGDEVIFESHAHPGGSLPWLNQARQRGVVVKVFEPDQDSAKGNIDRIIAQMTPRTRVIQVSHITATTGLVMPVRAIAKLAKERNCWFHVDGAQSAGMIPVDLHALGCDSYATSGHKWMGAPHETGLLYIREAGMDRVEPQHIGAHSSDDFDYSGHLGYVKGARRHEYGTRNAAAVVGLAEAVRFHTLIGSKRIAEHGRSLAQRLAKGLKPIRGVTLLTPTDDDLRASMTTLKFSGMDAGQLFGYLLGEHHFRCRPVTEQGLNAVRISTHMFNNEQQCDRLIAAVAKLSA